MGFGVEGKAVMEYLVNHNFPDITVCDSDVNLKETMPDGVSVQLGAHYLDRLEEFDVVFRSPGIRFLEPKIQAALIKGVKVLSSTKFFIDQCVCPVIGVTGTKGKGTTSTLLHKMLLEEGLNSYLGGNIGEPPITFLDDLKKEDVVVLELSSFQLQDLHKSPKYAILLNTTEDHLDYHADRDEYLYAKEQLLASQNDESIAILNKDYEYFKYYKPLVKGKLMEVSVKTEVADGAFVRDGVIFYAKNGEVTEVLPVSEVALTGSHNLENVMPAVVVAREFQVSFENIRKAIRDFKGLPHRLEFVTEVDGVRYFNDSYSTTAHTSMAAVDSFEEPTVLIAGGSDKGLNYEEWAKKILTKANLEMVVLIGDTAEMMAGAIRDAEKLPGVEATPTEVVMAKDLEEAVEKGRKYLRSGGVVVMSPAAASFGLFKNYKERGERFREIVGGM